MLNEDSETISTLLKLAQPAATAVLAISILSILFIIKAEYSRGIFYSPVYVYHNNSSN
tara:strand:- start:1423 stop:1596 length:174 start_codon:yes stop_codon:yes gene_type:complete